MATPDSIGMSAARLERIAPAMRSLVKGLSTGQYAKMKQAAMWARLVSDMQTGPNVIGIAHYTAVA